MPELIEARKYDGNYDEQGELKKDFKNQFNID